MAPVVQAIKKWNWAKTVLFGAMKRQREDLLERNIDASKDRQGHIQQMKSNIEHNNLVDKQTYEIKYEAERKQISFYEGELAKVMSL